MDLVYIWIDKFKNINDCGFNFSAKYNIEVTKVKGVFRIKVTTKENFIESFFGNEISNLTAIIGENGSGKSSLLEAIRVEWPIALWIYQGKDGQLRYNVSHNFKPPYKVKVLSEEYFESTDKHLTTEAIFYSPIVDFRNYPLDLEASDIDISTNELIRTDDDNEQYVKSDYDKIQLHKYKNIERQIDLIYSNIAPINSSKGGFELNIPRNIELRVTDFHVPSRDETWNLDSISKSIYNYLNDRIRASITEYADKEFATKVRTKKRWLYLKEKTRFFFLRSLVNSFFFNRNQTNHFLNIKLNVDIKSLKEIDSTIDAINYFAIEQDWLPSRIFAGFIESINKFFDDLEYSKDKLDDYRFRTVSTEAIKITPILSYQKHYISVLKRINSAGVIVPVDFNWRDISSGEKAIFDLFARLLYAKNQIIDKIEKNYRETPSKRKEHRVIEKIDILIDEGDFGLHPEWQKRYLSQLMSFLYKCFYHNKYIPNPVFQILLTSHSPILVSDIPKNNLLFLKRGKNGTCAVSDLQNHTKTFGANIHSLLSDSFFLKDGLIGEFARKKIFEILDEIDNSENIDVNRYKELNNKIEIIGEPLIRDKLKEELSKKLLVKDLLRRRDFLANELSKINDQLKSKNEKN